MEINLGDYFGCPHENEKKCKMYFSDLVNQLDPTYIIRKEDLDGMLLLKDEVLDTIKEPKSIAGKYVMIKGYGFRKCGWGYECLITPKDSFDRLWNETVEDLQPVMLKAKGDRSKNYYTRYKTSKGGKEDFNPVTKTGGYESVSDTKRKFNL